MKRKILFDTNIPILLSNGQIDSVRFADTFERDKWLVSIITRIEVLSKPELPVNARRFLTGFLSRCVIVPI